MTSVDGPMPISTPCNRAQVSNFWTSHARVAEGSKHSIHNVLAVVIADIRRMNITALLLHVQCLWRLCPFSHTNFN